MENKRKLNELRLEDYVGEHSIEDAQKLMRLLKLNEDELNQAIAKALERGCPLKCVNNMIFRAKDDEEFERKLLKVWNMGTIEFADSKSLASVRKSKVVGGMKK